ncbi:hypothetical protein AVEN_139177-1 [Araneus ventricosus]|uniref:Uncharacterized protein n=1 Tax=Araneus ventricosus TaxID=182803 RepID=A0A4Y2LQ30_ARAVE|nr:hypothetical protein AVEN_139177-1 [Araneus ventricosus]
MSGMGRKHICLMKNFPLSCCGSTVKSRLQMEESRMGRPFHLIFTVYVGQANIKSAIVCQTFSEGPLLMDWPAWNKAVNGQQCCNTSLKLKQATKTRTEAWSSGIVMFPDNVRSHVTEMILNLLIEFR